MATNEESNDQVTGPYADQALEMINIEYLTNPRPLTQEDFVDIIESRSMWLRLARLLGITHGSVREILFQLQCHIANNPTQKRCPCRYWVELDKWQDHWPGCSRAAREREREERERAAIERDRQFLIRSRQRAGLIVNNWGRNYLQYITRKTLVRMRNDIDNYLRNDSIISILFDPFIIHI